MRDDHPLSGGFPHPAHDAARAFRAIMEAMACPGTIARVSGARPPAPLSAAAGAALLTLADADTPLYLAGPADTETTRAWVAFHTGAPRTAPADCHFALGPLDALLPLDAYRMGTPEYPDRSATLIVEVASLANSGATLRGPGIDGPVRLSIPDAVLAARPRAAFPLGLDLILTAGDSLAALPRTTEVL